MSFRTINRSLVVHNDLAIGIGPVVQTRGDNTAAEQKIELPFIFRKADEIRYLNTSKYTRVALHTAGPLVEYYFDAISAAVDDGDATLAPLPAITLGRWLKVESNYTTANFIDATHAVNTSKAKRPGFMAWNKTANRPVWAVDSTDAGIWVFADGTTAHTPV